MEKFKVLIIDDEQIILDSLSRYLTTQVKGVLTAKCANYKDAIEHLRDDKFDLVITDLHLSPEKREGMEILRLSKELDPHSPVIVITASGGKDVEREARELGALSFYEKPFRLEALVSDIDKIRLRA